MPHLKKILLSLLAATLLAPAAAWAAPQVDLAMAAEKEILVTENGQEVIRRVPATEVAPGETVIFTITYRNTGDEPATSVVINNPLPQGTTYVPGSATDIGEVAFSIDGGESFGEPSTLSYKVVTPAGITEERPAMPEQYTHVRWQLPEIPAGDQGAVSFRVLIQ